MSEFDWMKYYLAFAVIIFFILYSIYALVIKNRNYFLHRNVVFEKGVPLLGSMYRYMLKKEPIAFATQNIYNKYPKSKFVGFFQLGGKPSYMIRDLDLVRDITIRDFDHFTNHHLRVEKSLDPVLGCSLFSMANQDWKDMRSTLSPLFTASKMRFMLTLMIECVDDFTAHIRNEIATKSTTQSLEFDTMKLMKSLSNDIIGSTAFGIKINTLQQPDNDFYKMGTEVAHTVFEVRSLALITFRKLAAWLKLRIIPTRHVKFFSNVIHTTLEERARKNIVRNDMLHLLLLAREGKLDVENSKDKENGLGNGLGNGRENGQKNGQDVDRTVRTFIAAKNSEKLKRKHSFLILNVKLMFFYFHFLIFCLFFQYLDWTDDDLVGQCTVNLIQSFICDSIDNNI